MKSYPRYCCLLIGLLSFFVLLVAVLGSFDFVVLKSHSAWEFLAGISLLSALRLYGGAASGWQGGWSARLLLIFSVGLFVWDFWALQWGAPLAENPWGVAAVVGMILLWLRDMLIPGGPLHRWQAVFFRTAKVAIPALLAVVVLGVVWLWWDWRSYRGEVWTAELSVSRAEPQIRADTKLLIIGLDGAHWEVARPLVESGDLPNLARLIDAGHSGDLESLRTYRPTVKRWGWWSSVVWTSLATGLREDKHGILDFVMPRTGNDWSGKHVPANRSHWRARPFWEVLSDAGIRCSVFGWWNSAPTAPFEGELVPLSACRIFDKAKHKEYQPEALWDLLELYAKDTAEAQYRVHPANLLREYLQDVRAPRTGAELNELIRTHLLDLDRNAGTEKEAEEVLRMVIEADLFFKEMTRLALQKDRSQVVVFYCEGTDSVQHHYYQYRIRTPEERRARGEEPDRLRDMVDNYYRLADSWVGELLDAAGPEWNVLVMSDHGHRHWDGNQKRRSDHWGTGLYIASGPDFQSGRWADRPWVQRLGIFQDEPSILDIAPTIHYLFGVPVSAEMDGRVLTPWLRKEVLESVPLYEVPDYRQDPGDLNLPDFIADRQAFNALLEQLGYAESTDEE